MHRIYDVNKWIKSNEPVVGARSKFWLTAPNGVRWLFKIPNLGTREHIMEKIAYELSVPLRGILPHSETQLATFDKFTGSISKSVLTGMSEGSLMEFNALVKDGNKWSSTTPRGTALYKKYGREYDVQIIHDTVYNINKDIVVYFIRTMLFDFLIGNKDRHHGNWGIIIDMVNGVESFCPLYDSGSGLLATKPEKTIIKYLKEGSLLYHVNHSISVIHPGGQNEQNFDSILRVLRKEYPNTFIQFAQEVDKHWTNEFLQHTLDEFGDLPTPKRKKLMYILLTTSRNELIRRAKAPAK